MKKCEDCAWEERCGRRNGEDGDCGSFWQKPANSAATDEIKMIEEMIHHDLGAI